MPDSGNHEACKRDGPPAAELSAAREAMAASFQRSRAAAEARKHRSDADLCWSALSDLGAATQPEIAAALKAQGFDLSSVRIASRMRSLERRRFARDTGRRVGKAKVWGLVPGRECPLSLGDVATVAPAERPPAQELRVRLDGLSVRLCIYRPRAADGVLRPSNEELRLHVDCLSELVSSLRECEAHARALGLIGGGA